MTPARLFALFRSDVQDVATPYLWEDAEIWEYMDDAQKMFCRLTWGVADSTSAITQLAAVAATPFTVLSPLILKIKGATRLSDFHPVRIFNYEDLPAQTIPNDYGLEWDIRLDNKIGAIQAMVVGMEANKVRWVPVPALADIVALSVLRLPLAILAAGATALEIDEQHHRALLMWMKHLAYNKDDAETFEKTKSADARNDFMVYCDQAKAERERREHKTGRSIAYGGL